MYPELPMQAPPGSHYVATSSGMQIVNDGYSLLESRIAPDTSKYQVVLRDKLQKLEPADTEIFPLLQGYLGQLIKYSRNIWVPIDNGPENSATHLNLLKRVVLSLDQQAAPITDDCYYLRGLMERQMLPCSPSMVGFEQFISLRTFAPIYTLAVRKMEARKGYQQQPINFN
jgi:hypothetical protein